MVASPADSRCSPTSTMTPPRTRTSPRRAGLPLPSTIDPPTTSKSPIRVTLAARARMVSTRRRRATLLVAMNPTNAIDLAAIRADTVGCETHTHLDNAGSSLPPRAVTDAVIRHLRREEVVGGYAAEA